MNLLNLRGMSRMMLVTISWKLICQMTKLVLHTNLYVPAPIPRKQRFRNLEVTDGSNYDNMPLQRKKIRSRWNIQRSKKKTIVLVPRVEHLGNRMRNAPDPHSEAKRVKFPLKALGLVIPDQLLNDIVKYTNVNIDRFLEEYADLLQNTDKYSYYTRVDLTDIRAFFGLHHWKST